MIKLFTAHTLAGLNVMEIRRFQRYQVIRASWRAQRSAKKGQTVQYKDLAPVVDITTGRTGPGTSARSP